MPLCYPRASLILYLPLYNSTNTNSFDREIYEAPTTSICPLQRRGKTLYALSQLGSYFKVHTGGIVLSYRSLSRWPPPPYRSLQNAAFVPQQSTPSHGCQASMLAKTQLFFSSEVSGGRTKWIQLRIVKRNGYCAQAIDVQEGIHAMSRNSSKNRSSNKQ